MKMTTAMLVIGSLVVFWASTFIMVFLPTIHWQEEPSDIWRPMTKIEEEGHRLFVRNGCSYCHTKFIRVLDWGVGAHRIAEAGDYYNMRPAIMGTERWGPDLSQEGGRHPNDWHLAHFINPRFTSPISVMPSWEFLGEENIRKLTAFVQYLGWQMASARMERQEYWNALATEAYLAGPDANIRWLHDQVPRVWREMPNPYPASDAALMRGKKVYQMFCINCHGPIGDGEGAAAPYLMPKPLNFTTLRRHLVNNRYIGGILYYQIMNGITGTAMPFFKKDLESEKIWDVSNFIAVHFIGYTDADISPEGIDAAYEEPWVNPYPPPESEGPTAGTPQKFNPYEEETDGR
ncbi:MAG: cbb3-type cytochrome c oxidase subunit II [Desulfuromonadales bacterium]